MADTYNNHDKSWNLRPVLSPTLAQVPIHRPGRRVCTSNAPKNNVLPVGVGEDSRFPKVVSVFKTSYRNDYGKKERVMQEIPRPQSPTRTNRPHPRNVYYLERLDTKQLVSF